MTSGLTQVAGITAVAGSGSGGGVQTLNGLAGAISITSDGGSILVSTSGSHVNLEAISGGSGTVTSVSVVSANGFSGSVANPTTTPAITINVSGLSTSKIAGGAFGRNFFATATTAAAQNMLEAGTVGLQIFKTATTAAAQNALGAGTVGVQIFQATTTAAVQNIVGGGTVTSVSIVSANGLSGTVANSTTTPAITLKVSALDASKIGTGVVSNSEFAFLDGVSSSIQTQFSGKQGNLQFQNQGVDIGVSGGISTVNFAGAVVNASATGGVLTVRCSVAAAGSGTVTSVSVVSANGFKGSVSNPTTTPAITIDASGISTSKIAGGTFGRNFFATATTAAAQAMLEGGTVGIQVFKTTTTAAAQNALGSGTFGANFFSTATTAAAQNMLEAGTVGLQVFKTATTAAAQNALGATTVGSQIFQASTSAAVRNIVFTSNDLIRNFGITIDGGGSVITTGSKGYITVPYAGTISNWFLASDVSGNVVMNIKRSGTSIIGSGNKPSMTNQQFVNASASGWTSVAVSANDIFEFTVSSVSTITRLNLVNKVILT